MSKRERYDRATPYYGAKTQSEIDADTIEALRAENDAYAKLLKIRQGNIADLSDEITRLREALKPFADLYDVDDGDDDCYPILNSDLRAARAAIGESDDKC